MQKAFQVNHLLIAILGLPTMVVFIYEDSVGLFSNFPPAVTVVAWLLVSLAIGLCIWQAISLIFDRDVTVCKGEISINQKMFSIIDEPGNTCIVSRNLSWTDEHRIMDSLKKKAKDGDLSIFVNEENDTVKTLREHGAQVTVYNGFIPKCRFTIKGYKGANSRLYIAKANTPERHVIYRHSEKDDVTLKLAEDVVDILASNS